LCGCERVGGNDAGVGRLMELYQVITGVYPVGVLKCTKCYEEKKFQAPS